MKKRNLFALAMATMAFAACSNDDDQNIPGGGQKGELIDVIGITFAAPNASTYADSGTKDGEATENNIYKAFVLAYEAGHADLMPGDWTVKEVGDGTTAIGAGKTDGQLDNLVTFNRVSMGDNVYVLANVPDLTLDVLTALAHNGENTEKKIQEFIHNVSKDYLNGLAYDRTAQPTGKYMMAGKATIPTNPTTPNGGTVIVPVELNREMAKVAFQAVVTGDNTQAAYGRVQLKSDDNDGIVIARVARRLSPFATLDSYFPKAAVPTDKDWSFDASGKDQWKIAFSGDKYADVTTAGAGTDAAAGAEFNNKAFNDKAQEYRFTWAHQTSGLLTIDNGTSNPTGKLLSPYFYVSPNYSGDSNCATVISTQATYVGYPVFFDENAHKLFGAAFDKYKDGTDFKKIGDNTADATSFKECAFTDAAMSKVSIYFATTGGYATDKADLVTATGLTTAEVDAAAAIITQVTKAEEPDALLDYYTGQKLYYRADVANYDATNSVSDNITKRNTFYQIEGTITTLGAKSIEDAINSDNINMQVVVKVMPWNWVINRPNM